MSLNSLQDNMSRRAASMAAMAKRSSNPQDIQAIQKSLVEGVQNGSIQPYVGIPLIQELTQKLIQAKAQMAQGMAGAGMPQGQPSVPIAQQVMQQAAQADQPQGLEALPSNLPQEYASGGIIAFEHGGEVQRFNEGLLVDANYPDSYYRRSAALAQPDPKSIESYVAQYKTLMPPKGATQTEYEEYLKNRSGDAEATKKQDLNLALVQFGLNLAAGKSPRALENLGEAGIKALPSVQEAYKQRRLADETSLRGRAELERMARAEEIDALKGGLGLYGEERKLTAEAEKASLQRENNLAVARAQQEGKSPTDLMNHVKAYVVAKRAEGSKKSDEALTLEGFQTYPGYDVKRQVAGMQVGAQMAGQGVTLREQDINAASVGIKEWNDVPQRDLAKKEFKEAKKKDQENKANGITSDLAGDVRRKWIQANTPGAKPAPAAGPSALPPGSRQVGTSGGKPVYETPDGKRFIQN